MLACAAYLGRAIVLLNTWTKKYGEKNRPPLVQLLLTLQADVFPYSTPLLAYVPLGFELNSRQEGPNHLLKF